MTRGFRLQYEKRKRKPTQKEPGRFTAENAWHTRRESEQIPPMTPGAITPDA